MRRIAFFLAGLFLVTACQQDLTRPGSEGESPQASRGLASSSEGYIVVFEPDVSDVLALARSLAAGHNTEPRFIYEHALKGFSASLSSEAAAALERHPQVAFVERDQIAHIFQQTVPTGVRRIFADDNANIDIDGSDDYRVDVDVAIIDTGIDLDHSDLYVVASTDCSGGSPFNGSCGSGGDDDNGHGTHVAGSVAAIDNGTGVVGVAPGARLWAVKVLRSDGSGYISWIVAGIDWVTARADQIEVANMSLGCACSSSALDNAIANSVDAGVAYAVAAGNSDADAKDYSPASHPDVLTVSALADFDGEPGGLASPTCRSDEDDTLANFSNWGSTVDIAAPGVCILSTWNDGGLATISGTSMASPHAAGGLALLASGSGDPTSEADVKSLYQTLTDAGNLDWTDDSGDGIQEPLLDVGDGTVFAPALVAGDGGGGETTTNSSPTANDDSYSTSENTTLSVAAPGVLENDDDPDSDPLTASHVSGPSNGSLILNGDGSFDYTPNTDFTGDDSFVYEADDGNGGTDQATVTITVTSSSSDVTAVHVHDLDGFSVNDGPTWTATVEVEVRDGNEAALDGVDVTLDWSYNGTNGSETCTTGELGTGSGRCDVSVGGIAKRIGSISFTVTDVNHSDYDASQNHDGDGDSDGTNITVSKP